MECHHHKSLDSLVQVPIDSLSENEGLCKLFLLEESLLQPLNSKDPLSVNKINTLQRVDIILFDSLNELSDYIMEPINDVQVIGCIGILEYLIENNVDIRRVNNLLMHLFTLHNNGVKVILGELDRNLDRRSMMDSVISNADLSIQTKFDSVVMKWLEIQD